VAHRHVVVIVEGGTMRSRAKVRTRARPRAVLYG